MRNRVKLLVGVTVVLFVMSGICQAKNTYAMTCSDVTEEKNQSLYYACINSSQTRGAMWLSSYKDSNESVDAIVNYDGETDVYLHGVVVSTDGEGSGRATCIKAFLGKRVDIDNQDGTAVCATSAEYIPYSFLDLSGLDSNDFGPYMERPGVSSFGPIETNVKEVELNVDDAISGAVCTEDGKGRCVYTIDLNIFRCYGGNEYKPGACYSDQSAFKISVPVSESFVGASTIVDDNDAGDEGGLNWKPDGTGASDYYADRTFVLSCDDMDNGCDVVFRHYIKRNSGNGKTEYSISKSVDGASSNVVSGENDGNSPNRLVKEDTVKIYPGQKICETLSFYADGETNKVTTTICAAATGSAESSIDVKIRDVKSGSESQKWGKVVYAKPSDDVAIEGTYQPSCQVWYDKTLYGSNQSIGEIFNNNNDPDWKNAFSIKIGNLDTGETFGNNGNPEVYKTKDGLSYNVQRGNVGKEIAVRAVTNNTSGTRTAPSKVNVSYSDADGFSADVETDSISSKEAMIYVPYNFKNSISIDTSKLVLYAGEAIPATFKPSVKVEPKENSKTTSSIGEKYATKVDNPSVRICVYEESVGLDEESDCEQKDYDGWDVDEDGGDADLAGLKLQRKIVPDVPAGTTICISAGVYPASSGAEDNWSNPRGDDTWATTEKCMLVAKKPSFQVWGGDVFVEENANVPLADKILLVDPVSVRAPRRFGSWGELSVEIGSGGNRGNLFSGAALGFAGNVGGELSPNYSYLKNGKTAEYTGKGNNVNPGIDPGGGVIDNPDSDNKGALNYSGGSMIGIEDFAKKIGEKIDNDDKEVVRGDFEIEDPESEGLNFGPNAKKMYVIDGDIIINKDIMYSGEYETLESIPKVIIYANNIIINCNVERIDAILIAEGNIETCPFAEGDEKKDNLGSPARSVQLRINGAVIAGGSVSFDRSYGAATGANSIIPAEIINMDPSWYLWAADVKLNNTTSTAGTKNDGLMIPTYVRELPPRY